MVLDDLEVVGVIDRSDWGPVGDVSIPLLEGEGRNVTFFFSLGVVDREWGGKGERSVKRGGDT